MKHNVYIIASMDEDQGIGRGGVLPWHFRKELGYFKERTIQTEDPKKQNMVIMGRTTWESIPEHFRPLPKRKNIVLTRNKDYHCSGAERAASLEEAFALATEDIETIFIIGGAQVYKEALEREEVTGVYLTRIRGSFGCDTFFPSLPFAYLYEQKLGEETEGGHYFAYYLYTKTHA